MDRVELPERVTAATMAMVTAITVMVMATEMVTTRTIPRILPH